MIRHLALSALCLSLTAITGCAADSSEPQSSEDDLTKKTEVLGDVPIGSPISGGTIYVEKASTKVRAYRFHALADDIVDISISAGNELSLLDSKGATLAKGVESKAKDANGDVVISKQKLGAEGDYLIAFRTLDAKANRPIIGLERNFSEAPISTFDCTTDANLDDHKESFTFDVAYLNDASRREFLLVAPEKDPNEYGLVVATDEDNYAMTLNENLSAGFENNRLKINGDGDGIIWVELELYENAGFKKGFLRVSRDVEAYSTVSCAIKEQKGRADF